VDLLKVALGAAALRLLDAPVSISAFLVRSAICRAQRSDNTESGSETTHRYANNERTDIFIARARGVRIDLLLCLFSQFMEAQERFSTTERLSSMISSRSSGG